MKIIAQYLGLLSSLLILVLLTACQQNSAVNSSSSLSGPRPAFQAESDSFAEVDCLLPGQVRKLGSMIYTSPRRPAKMTAGDCEVRGGEYVLYDRSNFKEALAVWMVDAEMGDATAQNYVGEIYMKSPPEQPRFDLAVKWLNRAAEQGFKRAQVNLAYLYENGLGVPRDEDKAVQWYAKASGADFNEIVQQRQLSVQERAELEALKTENAEQIRELKQARTETAEIAATLNKLQKELAVKEGSIAAKQLEIDKTRQEVASLGSRLAREKQSDVSALQNKLKTLKSQLAEKEKDLVTQKQLATNLDQQVRKFKAESSEYQDTIANLNVKLSNLPGPKIEVVDPVLLRTRGIIVAPVEKTAADKVVLGKVWSAAGLKYLKVNGKTTAVEEDGGFKAALRSLPKNKEVTVVAMDINGKSEEVQFVLEPQVTREKTATAAESVQDVPPVSFGKYYALVIGINEYRELPQLKTAVEDAQVVAEVLKTRYGFEVETLLNASRHDILSALNEYRKRLTEHDNLLIYYAGHGTLEEKNTQGFWLPVDSSLDNDVNWLPTDRVTGIMNLMSAKQILVIADACYSGIMTRAALTRLEAGKSDEAYQKWLSKMAAYKSRVVISSGETKPVLDGGGGKHSVFAQALLKVLQDNDKVMLGIDLHRAIAERVVQASDRIGYDQVPQYAGLNRAGHELGDFLFVPTGQGS